MAPNINYIRGLDRIIVVFLTIVFVLYFFETLDFFGTLFGFILSVVFFCGMTRFFRWAIPWIKEGFLEEDD